MAAVQQMHSRAPTGTSRYLNNNKKISYATHHGCGNAYASAAFHAPTIIKRKSAGHPSSNSISKKASPTLSQTQFQPPIHRSVQQEVDDYDEVLAMTFLQYCATCDKQIIVPSNAVLYCSESCRRQDSNKAVDSRPQTPFSASVSADESAPRDIVAPLSPRAHNAHLHSSASSFSSDEGHESEAARYLRSFYSNSTSMESSRTPRPRARRSAASAVTVGTAPSLSHTPASASSISLPFTPFTRPLPPSSGHTHGNSNTSKSVDLVLPAISITPPSTTMQSTQRMTRPADPQTSTENATSVLRYEKRSSLPPMTPSTPSSLSRLLGRDKQGQEEKPE